MRDKLKRIKHRLLSLFVDDNESEQCSQIKPTPSSSESIMTGESTESEREIYIFIAVVAAVILLYIGAIIFLPTCNNTEYNYDESYSESANNTFDRAIDLAIAKNYENAKSLIDGITGPEAYVLHQYLDMMQCINNTSDDLTYEEKRDILYQVQAFLDDINGYRAYLDNRIAEHISQIEYEISNYNDEQNEISRFENCYYQSLDAIDLILDIQAGETTNQFWIDLCVQDSRKAFNEAKAIFDMIVIDVSPTAYKTFGFESVELALAMLSSLSEELTNAGYADQGDFYFESGISSWEIYMPELTNAIESSYPTFTSTYLKKCSINNLFTTLKNC